MQGSIQNSQSQSESVESLAQSLFRCEAAGGMNPLWSPSWYQSTLQDSSVSLFLWGEFEPQFIRESSVQALTHPKGFVLSRSFGVEESPSHEPCANEPCANEPCANEIEILHLAVSERGAGVGTELLSAFLLCVKRKLGARAKTRILLEVSSRNLAAICLYSKLGFREFARRSEYYRNGSDAILMDVIVGDNVVRQ